MRRLRDDAVRAAEFAREVIGGEGQSQPGEQGTAQQEPARGPGRQQVAGVVHPARQLPGQLRDVRGQVDEHEERPEKERQVVQPSPGPVARALDGQHDPGAQDGDGGQDDERPCHPLQQGWRTPPHVTRRAGVVPGETPQRGADLQADRAQQQHPEEDVQGEQVADVQQGEALGDEQHEQHSPGHRRQAPVARRVGATGRLLVYLRFPRGHGLMLGTAGPPPTWR